MKKMHLTRNWSISCVFYSEDRHFAGIETPLAVHAFAAPAQHVTLYPIPRIHNFCRTATVRTRKFHVVPFLRSGAA
jgi:hypothetical protein